jgi:uncharacterized protein DUF4262
MDAAKRKALDDIEKFGCHVMHVIEEGDFPPFAYSVGITKTTGAPEAIVIGLKQPLAHFVINEYHNRIRAGEKFVPGQLYSGFLEGFECLIELVPKEAYEEHVGWDMWLYGGKNFELVQLIYPTTDGVWPWSSEASEYFRKRQPVLASVGQG